MTGRYVSCEVSSHKIQNHGVVYRSQEGVGIKEENLHVILTQNFWDKFTKVTLGNCLQISLFIAKNDFEFYNQSDDNKFLALRREDCVYDEILNSILLKIYRISIRKFERKWHQRNRTFNCYIEFTRVK